MKTEKEIRELRDSLVTLLAEPCDCFLNGFTHTMKCVLGGVGMKCQIAGLSWALGEGEEHAHFIDKTNERAAHVRQKNRERAERSKGKK